MKRRDFMKLCGAAAVTPSLLTQTKKAEAVYTSIQGEDIGIELELPSYTIALTKPKESNHPVDIIQELTGIPETNPVLKQMREYCDEPSGAIEYLDINDGQWHQLTVCTSFNCKEGSIIEECIIDESHRIMAGHNVYVDNRPVSGIVLDDTNYEARYIYPEDSTSISLYFRYTGEGGKNSCKLVT